MGGGGKNKTTIKKNKNGNKKSVFWLFFLITPLILFFFHGHILITSKYVDFDFAEAEVLRILSLVSDVHVLPNDPLALVAHQHHSLRRKLAAESCTTVEDCLATLVADHRHQQVLPVICTEGDGGAIVS